MELIHSIITYTGIKFRLIEIYGDGINPFYGDGIFSSGNESHSRPKCQPDLIDEITLFRNFPVYFNNTLKN